MTVGQNNRVQFRAAFDSVIPFKATVDIASLADAAGATETIPVVGAAVGDFVLVNFGVDLQDLTVTAYVDSADSVQVRVQNESGGVVDLASTTVTGVVLKAGDIFQGL